MRVSKEMENQDHNTESEVNQKVDNLLADPAKKAAILQQLTRLDAPHLSHSGSNRGGSGLPTPSGSANITPAPCITLPQGAFFNPAAWYNLLPFSVMPSQPFAWPNPPGRPLPNTNAATTAGDNKEDGEESNNESTTGDDEVRLLTEEEADQFREPPVFDPTVEDKTSWQPPEIMRQYLETNFDRNLSSH